MSKKSKKSESNAQRTIETITDEIKQTLSNDKKNIIARGDLLIEAKEMLEHGQWLPWLDENFDMSEDTAERAMGVSHFADKFRTLRNMDLRNLPKGVLYELADDLYSDQVVEAVLAEAKTKLVKLDRLHEIDDELNPAPEPEPEPEDEDDTPDHDEELDAEARAEAEAKREADDILDGPPPSLPSPPELLTPDPKLSQFDRAIKSLLEVHTASAGKFISTEHSVDDLTRISDFISSVADAIARLDVVEDRRRGRQEREVNDMTVQ
jgi:hypothetical protein